MKRRTVAPPRTSADSTSTSGSAVASRSSMSCWMVVFIALRTSPDTKEAGSRPLPIAFRRTLRRDRSCACDDSSQMHPKATVDSYLQGLEADWRRVAEGEWGLTVESAGWPLHIGM